MKRIALLLTVAALAAGSAMAAPKKKTNAAPTYEAVPAHHAVHSDTIKDGEYGMAGCGLGSLAIHDNGKWMQVLAATLNGTAGSQTFGMTSGTSNCAQDGVATASREKEAFIEANSADLRRDIAVGQGEYLSSLASLYGCKGSAAQSFGKAVHAHNAELIQSDSSTTMKRIDGIISQDQALHAACGA